MIFQLLRFLLVITGTVAGVALAYGVTSQYENILDTDYPEIKLAALLGCIGYLLMSMAGRELQDWIEQRIDNNSSYELTWGAFGLLLGLVAANLLLIPVYFIMYRGFVNIRFANVHFNSLIALLYVSMPLCINILFAYLGVAISHRYRGMERRSRTSNLSVPPKLVDTSAIIDGRFVELFRLGFIEGQLVIPRFVVNEMQFLADAVDATKRGKGRQALNLLNKLRKEFPDQIVIAEKDFPEVQEVDGKLVEYAKAEGASLITLDYNLKRVAEISQIKVLNLNELMNALKPIFISGEEIELQVTKSGKEPGQGVGFLSDGTMIVIEDGGGHIGKKVSATVTNILQTAAGRMIFARIRPKKS